MKNLTLSNRTKGVLFIIMSAFGFAMMSAFVKLSGDLPSFQKTFFRNITSCIIAFGIILVKKESFFGKLENQKILILRSLFGTLGIVFNFYAIDKLVLSDANMLNKLSPFFVIIFSALFLKEKINFKQGLAIIIAFIGALFIIKPQFNFDIIPSLIGVCGAICAAAAYTCLRVLGSREKYYTIVFYFSFFSTIVILPFMLMVYEKMTLVQFLYLILAGIFASIDNLELLLPISMLRLKKFQSLITVILYSLQ